MVHTIIMPDLGQTTAEGKILRWLKSPGEAVTKGEHLLEVETDKVTMEVESYRSGYLRRVLVAEGDMVNAMAPIAVFTDAADEPVDYATESPGSKPATQGSSTGAAVGVPIAAVAPVAGLAAAPAARTLVKELGVDLAKISGTGPGGLITRKDVELFARERSSLKPLAAMAALVTRSAQTIPHFYLSADIDVAHAERWREEWNASHPDLHASLNDVFVRVASLALRDVPRLNVSYHEGNYLQKPEADILLVVASNSGLVLAPVSDPGRAPFESCVHSVAEVIKHAQHGRVTELPCEIPPLLAVSNLGMFHVKEFSAIIPPFCTAALAIGTVRDLPVVCNQQIQVGRVATLTLSADHRVVDGIVAATFMEKIQEHLNQL